LKEDPFALPDTILHTTEIGKNKSVIKDKHDPMKTQNNILTHLIRLVANL